jgi:hypothetical protein
MKNPFKTRKILLISPNRKIEIEIPFIGKIRFKYQKNFIFKDGRYIEIANMKGQKYDGLVIDELGVLKRKK